MRIVLKFNNNNSQTFTRGRYQSDRSLLIGSSSPESRSLLQSMQVFRVRTHSISVTSWTGAYCRTCFVSLLLNVSHSGQFHFLRFRWIEQPLVLPIFLRCPKLPDYCSMLDYAATAFSIFFVDTWTSLLIKQNINFTLEFNILIFHTANMPSLAWPLLSHQCLTASWPQCSSNENFDDTIWYFKLTERKSWSCLA